MKFRMGFVGLALLALGCGSGGGEPPAPVYPVSGKVTFKGQPVVGADITFHHESTDRSAFGRTDDAGEYKLTTFSANDGAVEGKHGVTISKFEAPVEASAVADIESETYEPPGFNESTDPVTPKSDLPEKYGKEATSGLIAVVNKDAPNSINFELEE